jgi:hypothetical protein
MASPFDAIPSVPDDAITDALLFGRTSAELLARSAADA